MGLKNHSSLIAAIIILLWAFANCQPEFQPKALVFKANFSKPTISQAFGGARISYGEQNVILWAIGGGIEVHYPAGSYSPEGPIIGGFGVWTDHPVPGDTASFKYSVFFPAGFNFVKGGCDGSGHNCEVGQSMPPCLPTGCDPPAETKVEFFFPTLNDGSDVWYDVSLVDGYSISAEIIPSSIQGSCTHTRCAMSLDACPVEREVGDLRVIKNGRTIQCLSPCKKWNYPPPFGLGRPENEGNGLWYCCPTPPISPEQCRQNVVIQTEFVKLIHRDCPTAYSYSYDDEAGLHNCPNNVNFDVNFCI